MGGALPEGRVRASTFLRRRRIPGAVASRLSALEKSPRGRLTAWCWSVRAAQVSCRPFAWNWVEPEGADGGPAYAGVRRGEVVAHEFSGSVEFGGVATWTIRFPAAAGTASDAAEDIKVGSPELRAALDLRHVLDCRRPPAPVEGWLVCLSRSMGEWYYAAEGVGSQWHRPGLSPAAAAERSRCKSSCAIWGHRSKANVTDHRDRMDRIRRNMDFKEEKLARWRAEARGLTYYDWCGERPAAGALSPGCASPCPVHGPHVAHQVRRVDSREHHVRGVPAAHWRGALGRGSVHPRPPLSPPRLRPHCLGLRSQVSLLRRVQRAPRGQEARSERAGLTAACRLA